MQLDLIDADRKVRIQRRLSGHDLAFAAAILQWVLSTLVGHSVALCEWRLSRLSGHRATSQSGYITALHQAGITHPETCYCAAAPGGKVRPDRTFAR